MGLPERSTRPAASSAEQIMPAEYDLLFSVSDCSRTIRALFGQDCPVLQPVLQCLSGAGSTFTLNAPIGSGRGARQNWDALRRQTPKSSCAGAKAAAAIEAWMGAGARAPGGNLQYGC